METIKKNDFVEIEFVGKVKDGEVFDTNKKDEAEKIGLSIEQKPLIICVGQEMLIPGFDFSIEGKEVGKNYIIELQPKDAFKERKKELVKLIPLKLFIEKQVNPKPGMTLALDNILVRIIAVSGGRVLVDFNNPLSGKIIVYEFTIKRKIDEISEKINSIINFFFNNQKIDFEINEKEIVFKTMEFYKPLIEHLNSKFKELLGMEIKLEVKNDSEENQQHNHDGDELHNHNHIHEH